MIRFGFFLLIIAILSNCQATKNNFTKEDFYKFDNYFSILEWSDTLDTRKTELTLGQLHEVGSPIISDNIFYTVIDTSKLEYKRWDERLYAEGKMELSNTHTAYFVTRQMDDITYDRTTLILVFNKNHQFVQDLIFSEFIGYEGFITETESKLFKSENGYWQIESEKSESYFNPEKEEQIEKMEKWSWQFSVNHWKKQ
ncbi:MAG: hypothetical protein ACJAUH_002372 [Saprospiraceae bacterium]|jgi:hypothetical protein